MPAIDMRFGDCRDILPTLARSIDAVVADPPYGIVNQFGTERRRRGNGRRLQFAWDNAETAAMVEAGLGLAFDLCHKRAACFVFTGSDHYQTFAAPARSNGFTVKPWLWAKKHPPPAGHGCWWPAAFEQAYYGYRRGAWFGDRDTKRCNLYWGDALRSGNGERLGHPAQKPLALMLKIVESICPPGGLVLDPFCGSGTTGEACRQLGRRFIGIESNADYFTMAWDRLKG